MRYVIPLLTLLMSYTICTAQQQEPQQQDPAAQFPDGGAYKNAAISYNIIDTQNGTYGYDVFVDGRLTIHQTSIPGLPGNEGFKTREDAVKVAELVKYKISNGEMPPTVTIEEMKSMGAIH
jgi:hypothetical protein